MNFTAAQDFTSLTELLRRYADADEILYKSHCEWEEPVIAELCRNVRRSAQHIRAQWGERTPAALAEAYGIAVVHDRWQVADGKVIYLAECTQRPAQIRLNLTAIDALANLMPHWAEEQMRCWFTSDCLADVAIAHELYHLFERRPVTQREELAAHAFARALTALPFSPLLYQVLLQRLAKGERTIS